MLDENTKNLPSENVPAEEDKKDQSEEVKDSAEEIQKEEMAEDKTAAQSAESAETDKITEETVESESESDTEAYEPKEEAEVTEETVSKESEKESDKKSVKAEIPRIQFAKLSLDDLTKILDDFLRDYDIQEIKQQIEELKTVFTKKFKDLLKEKREEHVKSGGEESGFFYESPVKGKFDALIREYKRRRQQYYKDIEREQKENLETKLKLIDELKEFTPRRMIKDMLDNERYSILEEDIKEYIVLKGH